MDIKNLIILSITLLCLVFIFKKFNFLIDNVLFSDHKKIGILNKSPIILGGIYFTFSIILLAPEIFNTIKIICILLLFLGLSSDKNYLTNPLIRLILQVLILFILILNENLLIRSISINLFDSYLEIKFINIIFTLFCFAILINGSNFLDGLNGLLSGYYLIALGSLIYLNFSSEEISLINNDFINLIFMIVLLFFVLNIFGIVYLGDSGSYIISMIIGYILIKESQINFNISPYYIVLVLWYPAFENLFSLMRRSYKKKNVSAADKLHLHQLIFRYLKQKRVVEEKKTNTFTSLIILIFNVPAFVVANLNYSHTMILVYVIFTYVIIYLLFYFYLISFFRKTL
tara:strand:+ start:814 stop:1845 length:1032 start_codon:yes stop_codon:yes gene_type:complete